MSFGCKPGRMTDALFNVIRMQVQYRDKKVVLVVIKKAFDKV